MVTLVMVYIKMNRYNQVLLDICHFSLFLFMSARGTTVVMLTQENIFYWLFSSILTSKRGKKTEGKREREKAIPVYKRMSHYSRSASLASLTLFIDSRVVRVQIVKTKGKCLSPLFPFQSENFPFYAIVSKKRSGKECHLSFFYFHWLNKNLEESPTGFLKPRIASQHIILNRMNTVSEFQWSAVT